MKLIFDNIFRFYTSKMNEICLHCHWLYFSSITLSFGQGELCPCSHWMSRRCSRINVRKYFVKSKRWCEMWLQKFFDPIVYAIPCITRTRSEQRSNYWKIGSDEKRFLINPIHMVSVFTLRFSRFSIVQFFQRNTHIH